MSVAAALAALFGGAPQLALYSVDGLYACSHIGDFRNGFLLFYPEPLHLVYHPTPLGDVDAATADGLITRSDTRVFIFRGERSLTPWQRWRGYIGTYSMLRLADGATHDGLIGPAPST